MKYPAMRRTLLTGFAVAFIPVVQSQTITLSVVHDACGNGNGAVSASLLDFEWPVTAEWSTGLTSSGDTLDLTINGLFAGTYSLTITDALGAVFTESADVITVPSLQVNWQPSYSVTSCDGGCAILSLALPYAGGTAGGPYTVSGLAPGTYSLSGSYLGMGALCAGQVYDVALSDALGCTAETQLVVVDEPSPDLLLQSITGSCAGDANGSATFQFDMPVDLYVASAPGATNTIAISYPTPGQVQVDGLPAGMYQFYAQPSPNPTCFDTILVVVPTLPAGCGTLSGIAFADLDGDCAQAGGEPGLPNRMITISPTGAYAFTNSQGAYTRGMPLGAYTATIAAPGFDPNCPATLPAPFTLTVLQPDAQLDMAMTYGSGPDAYTYLGAGSHAPGFSTYYVTSVHNDGPIAMSDLTLTIAFDPLLSFVASDPAPTAQGPGFINWDIAALDPFSSQDFWIQVQLPPDPGLIGTTLTAQCMISGTVADANPSNDTCLLNSITVGAYDPNDKRARTSSGASSEHFLIPIDEHIDYTIRFQNTGTAPAQHVFLIDTIAPELDLGSFVLLAASHDIQLSLLPDRVLRFDFPNIQLPDSASDPMGSNGFARFRLRPFSELPGTLYRNAADIYFDFNPPIRTNTSELVAMEPMRVSDPQSELMRVYPNPASGDLRMEVSDSGTYSIDLIDPLGRSSMVGYLHGKAATIDLSSYSNGTYLLRLREVAGRQLHTWIVLRR
ncbi:MAG TPA: T9SS type A sorting domain-containing protein [Flavobacteriales bacterium]|nr:T9SS type A sorting domain-containing protein [Flavobacteriales bacterium]